MHPHWQSTVWDFFFRFFPERIIFISGFVDVLVILAKEDEQGADGQPPGTSFVDGSRWGGGAIADALGK